MSALKPPLDPASVNFSTAVAKLELSAGREAQTSLAPVLLFLAVLVGLFVLVVAPADRYQAAARIAAAAAALPLVLVVVTTESFISLGQKYLLLSARLRSEASTVSLAAIQKNWAYEGARFSRALGRLRTGALVYGCTVTISLAAAVLAYWQVQYWMQSNLLLRYLALSEGVAVLGSFAVNSSKIRLRLASYDFSTRMFAWAQRSLVLVCIGDALVVLVADQTKSTNPWVFPVVAGLVSAVLGERVIQLVVDKAVSFLGLPVTPSLDRSQLLKLDGVTADDVERFAEEGVFTLGDLAFTPTARLFFNTSRSLQHICDWQDQAMLRVYLGDQRAKNLFDQLGIRGVIDLQVLARNYFDSAKHAPPAAGADSRPGQPATPASGPAAQAGVPAPALEPASPAAGVEEGSGPRGRAAGQRWDRVQLGNALSKALGLDDAALDVVLASIADDEPTLRLRLHWVSTPGVE